MSEQDERVRRVAREMYERVERARDWDTMPFLDRQRWLRIAQVMIEAGFIAERLPQEALPDGQVRIGPDGLAWQRHKSGEWLAASDVIGPIYEDDDVRDWPVLVPENERPPFPDVLVDHATDLAEWIVEHMEDDLYREMPESALQGAILTYARHMKRDA